MAILAVIPFGFGLFVLVRAWLNGTDADAPEMMRGENKPFPMLSEK